jgi:hypothetical protein
MLIQFHARDVTAAVWEISVCLLECRVVSWNVFLCRWHCEIFIAFGARNNEIGGNFGNSDEIDLNAEKSPGREFRSSWKSIAFVTENLSLPLK